MGALKELNALSAQAQSNQQAFISALQKLADKQVARHYASSSHINLLTQHVSSLCFNLLSPTEPTAEAGSFTVFEKETALLSNCKLICATFHVRKKNLAPAAVFSYCEVSDISLLLMCKPGSDPMLMGGI